MIESRPRRARSAVVLGLVGLVLALAQPASASTRIAHYGGFAEPDGSGVAIDAVSLPFTPTIKGAGGQATVALTLPDGATPVRFTGLIKSTYAYDGTIVVTINGRQVADVPALTGGAINASASEADVDSGVLVIGMYASLLPREDCFVDENSVATLTDAFVTYGHPVTAPTTIGSFLSQGLTDLTVQIPARPTQAEQVAGLDAVAALAHRFRPPTVVSLLASDSAPSSDFLHRTVVVRQSSPQAAGTGPQATVGGTIELSDSGYLVVTGSADALASTAVALADRALALVEGTTVTNVSATADWSPATGKSSLADLGVGTVSLSGVGRVQSVFGVGQPSFGQSLSDVAINLRGVVTPLPPLATGRIDVLWNGTLAASRDMSDDTAVDIKFGIESDQLNRDNTVTVILSYVPPSGGCAPPPLAARLDIDATLSTVTPSFGDSVKPGFDRFPQVLGATIPLAIGPAGRLPELLGQAGDLVSALSSATPEQLTVSILTPEQFSKADFAGVMVGADASSTQALGAPYAVGDVIEVRDQTSRFSASIKGPLALAQAFNDGTRDVVLLGPVPSNPSDAGSSVAIGLTTAFTEEVAVSPLRWSALTGRVMAMGATRELQPIPLPEPGDGSPSALSLLVIGLVITAAILVALLVWSRKRPHAPPPPLPGSPSPA